MQIKAILSLFAILPAAADQTDKPAIVVVIDSYTRLDELCHTFFSLSRATGFPNAPIVAFAAIPLQHEEISTLRACTSREVKFRDITGFHAAIPDGAIVKDGVNYDYPQTQRFLARYMWDMPVLEPYDVLMHISDQTCLTFEADYLPGFPPNNTPLNYKSYSIPGVLEITKNTVGLYDNTIDYTAKMNMSPVNIELWTEIVRAHDDKNGLPKFSGDFEIVRKSFMQSHNVRAYHHHIADSADAAKEMFNRMWPASCLMYMTVAMFADADSTSVVHVPGIVEKNFWTGNYFPNICREPAIS